MATNEAWRHLPSGTTKCGLQVRRPIRWNGCLEDCEHHWQVLVMKRVLRLTLFGL